MKANQFIVVEVMGFGAVWIFTLMPTFWRNMFSVSSRTKVIRQGNRGLI
jgi:hypothetical protein